MGELVYASLFPLLLWGSPSFCLLKKKNPHALGLLFLSLKKKKKKNSFALKIASSLCSWHVRRTSPPLLVWLEDDHWEQNIKDGEADCEGGEEAASIINTCKALICIFRGTFRRQQSSANSNTSESKVCYWAAKVLVFPQRGVGSKPSAVDGLRCSLALADNSRQLWNLTFRPSRGLLTCFEL